MKLSGRALVYTRPWFKSLDHKRERRKAEKEVGVGEYELDPYLVEVDPSGRDIDLSHLGLERWLRS